MKPNEIRAALLLNDTGPTMIAKKLGVKPPCVSVVISGKRRTPYIREAIAKAINKKVSEVWPEEQ